MAGWLIAVIVIVFLILVIALPKSTKVIHQNERGIIERWGRFKEVLDPGVHFIIPFADSMAARIDMRENIIDVPPQPVITKDNVSVEVDAIIYYYVVDPKAVKYEIANFAYATGQLGQTNLRNIIGDMALDETLTSRERINTALRTTLDEATDKWGVKVTRVEVKEIEPPRDITEAMSRQMKAERDRRATILNAEGYKQKQILEAEGDKQNAILTAEGEKQKAILTAEGEREAAILKAEGDKQAAILRADGEAKAIETVSKAADTFFVGNAQALKQLEVTRDSLANNTKIVVSDQSRLINVLGLGETAVSK